MSIFLSILKIIGIILGILLAILLALVLLIVFLPICYRVEGDFQEKKDVYKRQVIGIVAQEIIIRLKQRIDF